MLVGPHLWEDPGNVGVAWRQRVVSQDHDHIRRGIFMKCKALNLADKRSCWNNGGQTIVTDSFYGGPCLQQKPRTQNLSSTPRNNDEIAATIDVPLMVEVILARKRIDSCAALVIVRFVDFARVLWTFLRLYSIFRLQVEMRRLWDRSEQHRILRLQKRIELEVNRWASGRSRWLCRWC